MDTMPLELINSGDVLLCSGNYTMSKLIRFVTGSPYSHVGVIYRLDHLGGLFVFEAVESIGVRMVPLANFLGNYRDHEAYSGSLEVLRFDLGEKFSSEAAVRFAASKVGRGYDYLESTKIGWNILTGQRNHRSKNDLYNCVEYAADQLLYGGTRLFNNRFLPTPGDFAHHPRLQFKSLLKP